MLSSIALCFASCLSTCVAEGHDQDSIRIRAVPDKLDVDEPTKLADGLDGEEEPFELDLPFATLELAAKAGDSDAVMDLLQLGQSSLTPDFDVHYPNPDGYTPLYWASWRGCSKCVDMMLDAGADVNQVGNDGASPLMAAASSNYSEVCSQLVAAGADLHAQSTTQWGEFTALSIAKKRHYNDVIAVLEAALEEEARKKSERRKNKNKKNKKKNKKNKKNKSAAKKREKTTQKGKKGEKHET